ncbi:MAG: hypothetical protein Cpurp_08395 [Chlorogloea purpurea SAG 13.99]|nr:hypothetical protein [Chlorogloea purpurea SAG 13.99]
MKTLIINSLTAIEHLWTKITKAAVLASVMIGFLVLGNVHNVAADEQPLGQRIGEQLHETSVKSERPKTTGELIDEARQDIPLGERLKNITRDSAEAFQQFGQGITTSAKESVKEVGKNAAETVK